MEADDLTDEQKGIGSPEPEAMPKKRRAKRYAAGFAGSAPEGALEVRSKRKHRPKLTKKTVKEQTAVEAEVEGAPDGQKIEEQAPVSYDKQKVYEKQAQEYGQTPVESAQAPASGDVIEKHEEVAPAQKADLSPEEQSLMESKWKFEEQNPAESSPGHDAPQEVGEELNETTITKEPDPQSEVGAVETKTEYKALPEGQNTPKRIIGRRTLKKVLIALAIVAIVFIFSFYALSRSNSGNVRPASSPVVLRPASTTTSSTSTSITSTTVASTTTAPTAAAQVHEVTAHTVAGSYSGNSIVSLLGTVSPSPGTLNSAVLISIVSPSGVQVDAAEAPVSASGLFNLSFMAGGTSGWSNGTYTVTSNYYGTSGKTAFFWTATSAATANDATNMIVNVLCSIYSTAHSTIFLLSILLVVLGAAVYAFGHTMPGQHKGQFQGYGMNIVIGGVVGTMIAVLAPFMLKTIASGTLPMASCISGLV